MEFTEEKKMLVELRHLLENGLSDEQIKDYFSNFKCKKDKDIDKFLTEYAISYEKNGVSRTTLVLDGEKIVGYFSIGVNTISYSTDIIKKLSPEEVGDAYEGINLYGSEMHPIYKLFMIGKNDGAEFSNFMDYAFNIIWARLKQCNSIVGIKLIYLDCYGDILKDLYAKQGFIVFDEKTTQTGEKMYYMVASLKL